MMNSVLLIHVPSRREMSEGDIPFPLGLMYVGDILERLGKNVKIHDLYLYDFPYEDRWGYSMLKKIIENFSPDIIGYGGIAMSYGWAKILSLQVKKDYPDITQIAGGALSSVYDLLLTKSAIDVVFHGEVETNMPVFVDRFDSKKQWTDIPGISYFNNEIKRNPPVSQIENLDDIPYPAYHLVDIEKYYLRKQLLLDTYREDMTDQGIYESISKKLNDVDVLLPIVTARGCTHRCSFCYRHMRGYRKHSVDYIIKHIKYVQEKFGINGFAFRDELFNGNMKWVFELCDEIDNNDLKIAYRASARVDNISEKMLARMYETGCFNLLYGQESGSEKILKEYKKGITRKQNLDATLLTRKVGIYSTVQLVIGSPGETRCTIQESIDFLKEVGVRYYSLNYLIPLPESPIWHYALENRLVNDVEDHLEQVAVKGGGCLVNLTQVPDKEWSNWSNLISYKVNVHRAKSDGNYVECIRLLIKYYCKRMLPGRMIKLLKTLLVR